MPSRWPAIRPRRRTGRCRPRSSAKPASARRRSGSASASSTSTTSSPISTRRSKSRNPITAKSWPRCSPILRRTAMPLLLDSARREDGMVDPGGSNARCIEIALINNMPDAALESTERQFVALLDAAAGPLPVRLTLYALPQVPRTDWGRSWLANRYSDIDELWGRSLDAVIVTGTEPRAPALVEESYWPALTRIMDWAEENTRSSVWSCLAAHAAVAHIDGIERQALREKCSGVLDCAKVADHPLMKGTPVRPRVPHSRCNGLP